MIRVSSYNCKSLKRNVSGISKTCDVSDIVFLQEHWLFPEELPLLNNVHRDFTGFGSSSIDPSAGVVMGRPFGGVGVLWKNALAPYVKATSFDDRIVGLECCFNGTKFLFLGIYLPYDTKQNLDQYVYYLAKLKSIVDDFESPFVCILGDFNADVFKQTEFGRELTSFCRDVNLKIADVLLLPQTSITHVNDGSNTESWLDHIVCTDGFYSCIQGAGIDLTVTSSDHFPISINIGGQFTQNLSFETSTVPGSDPRWIVDWTSLGKDITDEFSNAVKRELSNIHVPYDVFDCDDGECNVHRAALNAYYEDIIGCLRNVSRSLIANKTGNNAKRVIPGWTEFVEEKHTLYGDIYALWAMIGKPRQGYIYTQMCVARSQFKYALRFCFKKNEQELRAKALADKYVKNPRNMAAFWKEVHKLNSIPL